MVPTSFDQSNLVLNPPPGVSPEQCAPLSVWRGPLNTGEGVVISCWKLTLDEVDELLRTGRIWLICWGETMPPVALSAKSPFKTD